MSDLAGRSVLVAGAGVTGGSVVRALLGLGARVTVTDERAEALEALRERARGAGDDAELACVAGLQTPPEGTSLVVTSPGWRPQTPVLRAAAAAGVEVLGDVELAWRLARERGTGLDWYAVTGTNGKTTTVTMLAEMLRASGANAAACGNVGYAVLDAVLEGYDVLAVELSSFQLHWSATLAPRASVVLNVAEDHLDWHGSFAEYARAKGAVHAGTATAVYNAGDAQSRRLVAEHAPPGAARVGLTRAAPEPGQLGIEDAVLVDRAFPAGAAPARPAPDGAGPGGAGPGDAVADGAGLALAELTDLAMPGGHNVDNALAAAALARAYGASPAAVRSGLREVRPGAHRAALVAELAGVRYVDDSKATNPHAAAGSLLAYEQVVWIAGGQLKGASPATLDDLVAGHAHRLRGVVLIGADAESIGAALARHAPEIPVKRPRSGDDEVMMEAVRAARAMARPGDVVLLAPAGASHDMYRGYAHRGAVFADAVHALGGPRDGG